MLKLAEVVATGALVCRSFRIWAGRELLPLYGCCMPLAAAISALGDIDMFRWLGEGVDRGDPWLETWSPSEWAGRAEAARALLAFLANASAVSRAASSTVPVW